MLRFVGALFVVAGASGFGYLMAGGLDDRAATLRRLVAALQHLESDITFAALPLSAALHRAAGAIGHEVGRFLQSVADTAGANDGSPFSRVWTESLSRNLTELLLDSSEVEALTQLGDILGGSDREDQRKHLALAQATLARRQAEAEAKATKTKRVWQYLGFALGVMAVIFLV